MWKFQQFNVWFGILWKEGLKFLSNPMMHGSALCSPRVVNVPKVTQKPWNTIQPTSSQLYSLLLWNQSCYGIYGGKSCILHVHIMSTYVPCLATRVLMGPKIYRLSGVWYHILWWYHMSGTLKCIYIVYSLRGLSNLHKRPFSTHGTSTTEPNLVFGPNWVVTSEICTHLLKIYKHSLSPKTFKARPLWKWVLLGKVL